MSSSYFITFGGNRVTYHGVTGPVAWENPSPLTDTDVELWRNPGTVSKQFTTSDDLGE